MNRHSTKVRYFKLLSRLYAGKEAYDPIYQQKVHIIKLKHNKEKLHELHSRVKQLLLEIKNVKKIENKERIEALKHEIGFLKSKIQLLKS